MGASLLCYVGSYAAENTEGIHRCLLDPATGSLSRAGGHCAGVNPSFLALHPAGTCMWAVTETGNGGVSAFAVEQPGGGLRLLNRQASHGLHPCHLCCDRSGHFVLVANYASGTLAVCRADAHGRLEPASHVVQHRGRGLDPKRQEGPHAHYVSFDPTGRFVLACDLGIDKVLMYRLDRQTSALLPHGEAALHAGAGPRHLDFHPSGRWVYVMNELDPTVTAFAWDAEAGTLAAVQTASARYGDGTGPQSGAEVAAHPSGRFVYASVRGCESMVVYRVDQASGKLTYASHVSCGGTTPRHFAIAPGGELLLVANQDGDSLVSFGVDSRSGKLKQLSCLRLPKPACVVFGG